MRLLRTQCDDDGHFSLVEFECDKIPEYAILSHTWLENNQEVTFEDLNQRSGLEKDGYGKLRFCAGRAQDAGLHYFWVDTCCIKKSDSTELSEAINSMFSWYSRSAICYAYLADVTTEQNRPRLAQFHQSRWHKRGWTLQELLAPKRVDFWSRDGVRLGDRQSLEQEIHHATGIPVTALRGESLQSFPVQERYRWMSGRQTKLEEDQAYCLLGIFDVSIAVIYGERPGRSASRLNDEIARTFRNNLHKGETSVPNVLGRDTQESLSPIELRARLFMSLKQDTFNNRRLGLTSAQTGTCQWLMDHTVYESWENPDELPKHRGFLWIKGKPGAGKSTMMKYIYDQTEETSHPTNIVISFFFNARGADPERSTSGMWRALLYQLLTAAPDLQPVLDTAVFPSKYDTAAPPWTVEMLSRLFKAAVLQLGNRHLTCFIDALDECDEEEVRSMVDTLQDIGDEALGSRQQLRVCFASRHYPHISLRFGLEMVLEQEAGHSDDLSNYIRKQLRAHKSKKADEIRLQIEEKANGVFMWAVIVIPMLRRELDKGRIHAVKQRLTELPRELSDLFRDMLGRDKDNLAETVLGYQWILFAARPLNKQEYYYAVLSGDDNSSDALVQWDPQEVTEEDMKQFVSSSSKGLAEVTGSNHTVQFIHESVRDFLLKEEGFRELANDLGGNVMTTGHARLTECCQAYLGADRTMLILTDDQLNRSRRQDCLRKSFPFIEYASEHILSHANKAAADLDQEQFLETFPLPLWIDLRNLFEHHPVLYHTQRTSMLYVLAGSGCQNLIQYLCRDGLVIGEPGEYYHYPLFAALAHGHYYTAAAMLLSEELKFQTYPEFGAWYERNRGAHPVVWALTQAYDTIAEKLLQAKDFHWEDADTYQGRSLLCLALEGNCIGVVKRLAHMDRLAGLINAQHQFRTPGSDSLSESMYHFSATPLGYAAASGYVELSWILIDLGAEICPDVPFECSPLYCAIRFGSAGVVSLLFERSTTSVDQFSTVHMRSWTPLCTATIYHRVNVAKWLLNHGAKVNLSGQNGQTPLHLASQRGNEDMVRTLLAYGAGIEAFDDENKTALHMAAANGHLRVLEALLAHVGTRVTASHFSTTPQDGHWRPYDKLRTLATTAGAAANRPRTSRTSAKALGILETRDYQGATPLISAAQDFQHKCIKALLQRGARIDACNHRGETALMQLRWLPNLDMDISWSMRCMDTLLEHSANVEIRDHQGMTALLHVAQRRSAIFVVRLLQAGADRAAKNHRGESVRDLFPNFNWDQLSWPSDCIIYHQDRISLDGMEGLNRYHEEGTESPSFTLET